MFFTTEECYKELYTWLKAKPTSIQIGTFGIYAGILDTGKSMHEIGGKYASSTHKLLDEFCKSQTKIDILVGVAPYRSCKGKEHCEDCYKTYGKQIMRLLKHAENWPKCTWRFKEELHLKCTIFNYLDNSKNRILGGGRNFTDSDWADISFELPKDLTEPIQKYFTEQWDKGLPVTEENLTKYVVSSFEKVFATK